MKKLTSIFAAIVLIVANSVAQSPEKMSYQAVIRNSSNQLVTNQQVGMQISILKGSTPVYIETHLPTTNDNGLATLEVGAGTLVAGSFSSIDWSNGTYFIKTETDPSGGTNYSITGTSQLLSVPYALYAKTAGSLKQKSLSLNIYGSFLGNNTTFSNGFGRFSNITFPDNQNASFYQNFTVPADYVAGDTIFVRMIVSGDATGIVGLEGNAVSVARPGVGFIQGGSTASGLNMETINIATVNVPQEALGYILSPDGVTPIEAGDAISFSYYRTSDANSGNFRIHSFEILY